MRIAFAGILVLSACSTATQTGEPVQTATVTSTVGPAQTIDITRETLIKQVRLDAPRAQVWQHLMDIHQTLGIPFKDGDMASGSATFELSNRIGTVAGKRASRYLDCGMGPAGSRADSYRLVVRLTHVLENPSPNTTVVTTRMQSWARNPGLSSDAIPCTSLGVLETEIGGMLSTRTQ